MTKHFVVRTPFKILGIFDTITDAQHFIDYLDRENAPSSFDELLAISRNTEYNHLILEEWNGHHCTRFR